MSRVIRCHYDFYSVAPVGEKPGFEGFLELIAPQNIAWQRLDRQSDPSAFTGPSCAIEGGSDPLRKTSPDHVVKLHDILARVGSGFRITCQTPAEDLSPLQAAMGLLGACAAMSGDDCVVIDRTTGIGYLGQEFYQEQDLLNDQGHLDVRDHILIYDQPVGNYFRIRTYGMEKFGQLNFMFDGIPAQHAPAVHWFLNLHLCQYAGLERPIVLGQTFGYNMKNGGVLAFTDAGDCLLANDCQPPRTPVQGLRTFLHLVPPLHAEWKAQFDEQERLGSAGDGTVRSLDDYVALLKLLNAGQMDQALQRFSLTYETLATVTSYWSERLADPTLAAEFSRKMA